jgi:DNA mismatch repair protein MutL
VLRRQLEKGELASAQHALFTSAVELAPVDTAVVLARQRGLLRLGLEIEPFGGSTVALKSVPAVLAEAEPARFLPEVARALPEDAAVEAPAAFDPALKLLACHAAGEAHRELSHDELAALCRELDQADFHTSCLHGNVVVLEMPLLELERRAAVPKKLTEDR